MRKLVLRSALLAACLALAGCTGAGTGINRLPVDADLLDRVMAEAISDCGEHHSAGEIASHEARARCETGQGRAAVVRHALDYAFGDLAALLTARRMQFARQIDSGTIAVGQAAALYTDFHAAFLREARVRERLHNGNRPYWEFNNCKIEGNGLQCMAQIPTEEVNRALTEEKEKCFDRAKVGELSTLEDITSCTTGVIIATSKQGDVPHKDLTMLQVVHAIDIARRYDAGTITKGMFKRKVAEMVDQLSIEKERRDRRRAAGDLNWLHRNCAVEGDLLVCTSPPIAN